MVVKWVSLGVIWQQRTNAPSVLQFNQQVAFHHHQAICSGLRTDQGMLVYQRTWLLFRYFLRSHKNAATPANVDGRSKIYGL